MIFVALKSGESTTSGIALDSVQHESLLVPYFDAATNFAPWINYDRYDPGAIGHCLIGRGAR